MESFRDPPHYLRQLKTTTVPRRLAWLACAGQQRKKRDHFESYFQAAAVGRTWWTARNKERRDTVEAFDTPADLWASVAAWCPQGRRVVLFAYDLAEQMRLSQLLTHLPMAGWNLDKIVMEATASWCLLRSEDRSLLCCDLKSWAPVEWSKLTGDVLLGKPLSDDVYSEAYSRRPSPAINVYVIREAVLQILDWIKEGDLGPFRPTGSGQSFSAYRRRFGQHRLLVHDDIARLQAERRAMYTGRAEAWRHGTLRAGPYVEYDLQAAYATIGRDCDIPTIARGRIRNPSHARLERVVESYAVLADVTVTTDVECVPYNLNGRTLWPVGTFRSVLWDPELRLALEHASNVKVHCAWLYTRAPALRDFCTWVLDGMQGPPGDVPPIVRRVLKHWSRCLVGRMGLRYRSWYRFGEQDPPDVRLVTYWDMVDQVKTEMLLAGTTRLVLGEMAEARESLPQIPGWIMSECRRRLWAAARHVGLGNVVYVDTDSIITAPWRGYDFGEKLATRNGETWTPKGKYPSLTIHGPRNLFVGGERRMAGLPLTARQHAPLEFSGEVMRSVKESMRNGELDTVVTLPREFRMYAADLRREHLPDGHTAPFRLEAECGGG